MVTEDKWSSKAVASQNKVFMHIFKPDYTERDRKRRQRQSIFYIYWSSV